MGFWKARHEVKRMVERAAADPAIRDAWVKKHNAVFMKFQTEGYGTKAFDAANWRAMFEPLEALEAFEDGPPCRQELEWWRAMCVMRLTGAWPTLGFSAIAIGWFPAIRAMVGAIDEMLPEATIGPSDEHYP